MEKVEVTALEGKARREPGPAARGGFVLPGRTQHLEGSGRAAQAASTSSTQQLDCPVSPWTVCAGREIRADEAKKPDAGVGAMPVPHGRAHAHATDAFPKLLQ